MAAPHAHKLTVIKHKLIIRFFDKYNLCHTKLLRFSFVLLPGGKSCAGFRRSQLNVILQSITGDISSSFAVHWVGTLQNPIFRLGAYSDLVHNHHKLDICIKTNKRI